MGVYGESGNAREAPHVSVTVWTDFLCPWCWIALPRIAWIAQRAELLHLPLEIHPEIPGEGVDRAAVRRAGDGLADRLRALARDEGVALSFPSFVPNTRRAHQAAEWVREREPGAFDDFHDGVFRAYWVDHHNIGEVDVLIGIATSAGVDADALPDALSEGAGAASVAAASERAGGHGAYATPSFLIERGDAELLVPGLQPREFFDRALSRVGTR